MKRIIICFVFVTVLCSVATSQETYKKENLPTGFVYLSDVVPDILLDIRYYSTYNFVGARVDGYLAPVAIITLPAAEALKKVSKELLSHGYLLKIFDVYRPQKAVDHFVRWAKKVNDTLYRQVFYPHVDKSKLFALNYIAAKSGHTRGSTVDLTLVDIYSGKELDMGAPFDFFGPISGHGTNLITPAQTANRDILKNAMMKYGFRLNRDEWWHYSLINEPYPDTYFNFDITR
jgi:D-alanyl-D-alanine dipeptidase